MSQRNNKKQTLDKGCPYFIFRKSLLLISDCPIPSAAPNRKGCSNFLNSSIAFDFYHSGLPAYDTLCPTEPLNNKSLFILGGLTWTLSSSFVYEYYFLWPDAAYAINYIPSAGFLPLSFPLSGADTQPLGLAYLTKLYIGTLTENSRNYSYTSTYIFKVSLLGYSIHS